jgi:hypothetical protein
LFSIKTILISTHNHVSCYTHRTTNLYCEMGMKSI